MTARHGRCRPNRPERWSCALAAARASWRTRCGRSLTILMILIGVASVISLVAVGTGSTRDVQKSISRLGTNTLSVLPDAPTGGARRAAVAAQLRRSLGSGRRPIGRRARRPARPRSPSRTRRRIADARWRRRVDGSRPASLMQRGDGDLPERLAHRRHVHRDHAGVPRHRRDRSPSALGSPTPTTTAHRRMR